MVLLARGLTIKRMVSKFAAVELIKVGDTGISIHISVEGYQIYY